MKYHGSLSEYQIEHLKRINPDRRFFLIPYRTSTFTGVTYYFTFSIKSKKS